MRAASVLLVVVQVFGAGIPAPTVLCIRAHGEVAIETDGADCGCCAAAEHDHPATVSVAHEETEAAPTSSGCRHFRLRSNEDVVVGRGGAADLDAARDFDLVAPSADSAYPFRFWIEADLPVFHHPPSAIAASARRSIVLRC